jgi:fatty-acyl-CoA synthase
MEGHGDRMYQLLLGEIVARNARKFPGKCALKWAGGERSYGEMNSRINALAHVFMGMGVGKGDKVGVLLANGPEIIECCYAAFKIGAVAVPLNFRLSGTELEYIIHNAESRVLVLGKEFTETVRDIRANLPLVGNLVVAGAPGSGDMHELESLIGRHPRQEPQIEIEDDDDALILYTSGTTGRPKGAVMSHKAFLLNALTWSMAYHAQFEDKLLCIPPLFHVASLGYTLSQFYVGATVHIESSFDPKRTWEIVDREKITTLFLVPAMWIALLQVEGFHSYDRSSLRILNTGAAIMPVEVKKRVLDTFPNAGIFDCFGQTEMSGGVTILDARDALRKPGSVGKAVPLVEILLVDDQEREVRVGEVGEAVYRGPTVTKGYYRNVEATREAMKGGWFHSGDLLRQDSEGFYYVVDRKKDMIISGGENIYPAEVEEVLYSHPEVLEAAVIGIPDTKWGESVKAVLALKPGKRLSEEEVIEFCKTKLASYKKPKSVEFVDALPKSAAGKILKTVIREKYWADRERKI